MPDSYNDRSPTPSASLKPARTGTANPAINTSPGGGTTGGGLSDMRARALATGAETLRAAESRPVSSKLRATRAPIAQFSGDRV